MTDELIEQVARALELSLARDVEKDVYASETCIEERRYIAAALLPIFEAQREDAARRALEAAATVAPSKTAADECETVGQWTRRTLREAIRAIDPAQFRMPA